MSFLTTSGAVERPLASLDGVVNVGPSLLSTDCCLEDVPACGLDITSLVSHVGCSDSAHVLADGGNKVG